PVVGWREGLEVGNNRQINGTTVILNLALVHAARYISPLVHGLLRSEMNSPSRRREYDLHGIHLHVGRRSPCNREPACAFALNHWNSNRLRSRVEVVNIIEPGIRPPGISEPNGTLVVAHPRKEHSGVVIPDCRRVVLPERVVR